MSTKLVLSRVLILRNQLSIYTIVIGHAILLSAASCHFCLEIFHPQAVEPAKNAQGQEMEVPGVKVASDLSPDRVFGFASGLYLAGYFILTIESFSEVVAIKQSDQDDDSPNDDDNDPYELDRWADDGGPCV